MPAAKAVSNPPVVFGYTGSANQDPKLEIAKKIIAPRRDAPTRFLNDLFFMIRLLINTIINVAPYVHIIWEVNHTIPWSGYIEEYSMLETKRSDK